MRPHDVPPWHIAYQQSQRWGKAGVFATMGIALRELLRMAQGRTPSPRRRFAIAARCNRRQRAARERVLTRPKADVVRKGTWRFRSLARDYEQLAERLKGLPMVAFAMLMLQQLTALTLESA